MTIKIHGIHHAKHIVEHLSTETEQYIFNNKVRVLPFKIKLAKKILLRNKKIIPSFSQLLAPLISMFIGKLDNNTENWKALYDNKQSNYEIISNI